MKKVFNLMLVLMLVFVLSGFETVERDGDELFKWEVKSTDSELPDEEADFSETAGTDSEFDTRIYDNEETLDVYISEDAGTDDPDTAYLYYRSKSQLASYSEDNKIDLNDSYNGEPDTYIHIEIKHHFVEPIGVIGGMYNEDYMDDDSPSYYDEQQYQAPKPTVEDEVLKNLDGIANGTIDIFETAFSDDGLAQIFYDFEANDGDGKVTVIGALPLLGVGFVLVRYGFKYVVRLMRFRG